MNTATRRSLLTAAIAAPALLLAACGGGDGASADGPLAENQRADDIILGDADAPVLLIEYASVTCPHCAAFHETTWPEVKEKYVDTGLVKYTFRELPTPPVPLAMAGFLVARCAPDSQYYDVLDTLFERQEQIVRSQEPREELLNIARAAGIDEEEFDACIRDEEQINRINDVVDEASAKFNVSSTPTFIIDGETYAGARALSFFDEKFAPLLGDQAPPPSGEDAGEDGEDAATPAEG